MKRLAALVLTIVSISCGYIFAQTQSTVKQEDVTPERLERLGKEFGLKNVAFAIAIDFDGNVRTLAARGKKYPDKLYPTKADVIQNVYTATFVAFKGSNCVDYIDSNGYKQRLCIG